MLSYASAPDEDWRPARKEDQIGRYQVTSTSLKTSYLCHEHINPAFTNDDVVCSKL